MHGQAPAAPCFLGKRFNIEIEEIEFLGKREIFGQEAVCRMRFRRVID